MDIEVIRRIVLARHLFELSSSSLRSRSELFLFSAVNLAQDSVETFLSALADYVGASFDQNTKFDKYFLLIEEKTPHKLPYRPEMLRLNRIRIDSKHHGIQPDRGECERLISTASKFLRECCLTVFGSSFGAISAIQLLDEGQAKQHLQHAKEALERGDDAACLIESRKAIFREIETNYDVAPYRPGVQVGLLGPMSKAPFYARSAQYLKQSVREPTEYIVLDHARVEADLLVAGADPTDFWNISRLTPQVYARPGEENWVVKNDFDKLNSSVLQESAEYVLSAATNMCLAIHNRRRADRTVPVRKSGVVRFRAQGTKIYAKADRDSEVIAVTPPEMLTMQSAASISGLNSDELYWEVLCLDLGLLQIGFIHDDDVLPGGPFPQQ